ncbi:DeoR/GlpR family DNA-binding transcription regulator [Lactiplantibacillus daowaiensis]|uniref:DeoR/GlpR family DNA-binding transcription regulator n=1 Tax=Lactiplantibacillus daowaiensis TaxID=2559918 RepID=A0ABW1S1R4_9LACO|nr:DeoR/GlpR family DNA-binding transcription regulator [Lactiplantibacillus daowaiensis]
MIPYERQERILQFLTDKDLVKIDEIHAQLPEFSLSTLRRDLKSLESNGKIEYLIGGGVKAIASIGEIPMTKKTALHSTEKQVIAERAAGLVQDGESVYIDSGSNGTLLLKRLLDRPVTIYTTNTTIFSVNTPIQAKVMMLGGQYIPSISSLSGTLTENTLRDLYFDRAFLGVNGVDDQNGVTTPNIAEATKKRLIKKNSKQTYLLCDSSKFHRTATVRAFDLDGVTLISDKSDHDLGQLVPILIPE